jgi:hypothetical protein
MDPKRLLEMDGADGADGLERELLASLRPPSSVRDEVWQRLAAPGVVLIGASAVGMAATAKASASTGALATGSAALFSAAKLSIVLAIAAPVVGGAIYLARAPAAEPAPAPRAALAQPSRPAEPRTVAPSEPLPAAEPEALAVAEPVQSAPKTADRPQSVELSAISEENRLLREARAASRAGDSAAALATLRVLDRRFPGGALVQERELLRVQALRSQGSNAEAEQRARRFLKLYPTSPYASHMKASLGDKAQ